MNEDDAMRSVVLDHLLEGCQIIGFDYRYRYVNDAAANQGKRPRERLLGRTMMEAYPGIEETAMFSNLRRCMEEQQPCEMENEFAFPDGTTGWFELRFEPVPDGAFILSIDITDRKRAEARIGRLNAVLRGIRSVSQLITRERDRDVLIQRACGLLVETRGFESAVIALTERGSEHIVSFAGSGRESQALLERLGRGELPESARRAMANRETVRDRRPSTDPARSLDEITMAIERNDRPFGFVTVSLPAGQATIDEETELLRELADDISHALRSIEIERERNEAAVTLARTEQQLLQIQKLDAIGQLAGGIAHDFNNLLMVQIGSCDLMQEQLEANSPLSEEVSQIRACAERAAALTHQLLAFSRKQTLRPEVIDLNEVVENCGRMLRRLIGENIDFVVDLAADLGKVRTDPGQIEQVIMNLIVNARDAMPRGGRLAIETSNVDLDEQYAREHVSVVPGPYVVLAVTDSGSGIDEETRSRIFEPFFTTKGRGEGTGLGLATVYGIVKQSGGNIWVYSEPGEGTTFKIYLPRVESEATSRVQRPAVVRHGRGELVLVVEDHPALRNLFHRIIENLGYRVRSAVSGGEALAAVRDEGLTPSLLITDVIMPGMSGKVLADRLREIRPGIKVLFMSGYTDSTIVHHGVLDSETPFLQKPFNASDLASKIREVLGSN